MVSEPGVAVGYRVNKDSIRPGVRALLGNVAARGSIVKRYQ